MADSDIAVEKNVLGALLNNEIYNNHGFSGAMPGLCVVCLGSIPISEVIDVST